jgi:hypothetical protein
MTPVLASSLITALCVLASGCSTAASDRANEADQRSTSAPETSSAEPAFRMPSELTVGTCLTQAPDGVDGFTVQPAPCGTPDAARIVAVRELPQADYPGEEQLLAEADRYCREQQSATDGQPGHFTPTAAQWESGERRIICVTIEPG